MDATRFSIFGPYLDHETGWRVAAAVAIALVIRRLVRTLRPRKPMFAGGTAASNSAVMDKTMVGGDEESKDPKTPENEGESEEVPESKTGEAGHGKTTERVTTDIESKNANTGERLQMPLLQPKIREEELEERRKILTDIENNKTDNARERSQMLLLQLKKREEELEERRKMLTKSKTIRVWSADAPEKQSILDKTALRSNDTKKKAESNAIVIHLANRWATKWREENKTQILKVAEIASDNAKKQRRRERAIVELEVSAERRKRREGGWIEGERCKERERIGRLPRVECDLSWPGKKSAALTFEQALKSCKQLGVEQLLSELNIALHTEYCLEASKGLEPALQHCISQNYDFGTVYALLRNAWGRLKDTPNLEDSIIIETIEKRRRGMDKDRLQFDEDGHLVVTKRVEIQPRRIWDLLAHRVIPYDAAVFTTEKLWAISHSWVGAADSEIVVTSVNGFEWPVHIPKGVTLETIRNELLAHGAEYCWLDIICLRQKSGSEPFEQLRKLEWEIDVPTIGNAYLGDSQVVRYYNGLGRPFKTSGWDSECHWSNRAWTLQESKSGSIIGGAVATTELYASMIADGRYKDKTLKECEAEWEGISHFLECRIPNAEQCGPHCVSAAAANYGLFSLLNEMRERQARDEVDKVAAIGFFTTSGKALLPAFYERATREEAWTRCVHHMRPAMRGELLFRFPAPGSPNHSWFPSWEQIQDKSCELPKDRTVSIDDIYTQPDLPDSVSGVPSATSYRHNGLLIEKCRLTALKDHSTDGRRWWSVTVTQDEQPIKFTASAEHRVEIPNGEYSLFGRPASDDFVVCQFEDSSILRQLRKISVVSVDSGKIDQSICMDASCRFV